MGTPRETPRAGGLGGKRSYTDETGICRSVKLDEIRQHDCVLPSGRDVGTEAIADDDEAFAEKMAMLTATLAEQMEQGRHWTTVFLKT
jgi:type I restriction enzyme M protein